MTDTKTGLDKARETRDKLAGAINEVKPEVREEVAKSLATIGANKELMDMYKESASLGSENIGGESLPLLKIHNAGRSLGNTLANGEEPHNGYFFYKKTQEEFKEVYCHILTVSGGFRADGVEGKKDVFNQIMGGAIIDGDELKPFLMYFTGTKLQRLWDFCKEVNKYKTDSIPMFALTVKLSTEKVVEGAKSWFVVNFEISKDTEGNPELVTDKAEFTLLRDSVYKVNDMISRLIKNKATEDIAQLPSEGSEGFDSAGNEIKDITFEDVV